MGAWKRCPKCKGVIETFVVIRKTGKVSGSTDEHREARKCLNLRCGFMEVVSSNNVSEMTKAKR